MNTNTPAKPIVRPELDIYKQQAIDKAKRRQCDGSCEVHQGEVKAVRIFDASSGFDWGYFAYCEVAIKEDEDRGMVVRYD